jgi:hypothetical protein
MRAPNSDGLTVKRVRFSDRQTVSGEIRTYDYFAYSVRGWLNGQRIRKQFKTHSEALTAKARLEVEAANVASGTFGVKGTF